MFLCMFCMFCFYYYNLYANPHVEPIGICTNPPSRHSFCVMKLAKIFFRSTPFGHVFSQSLYLILYEETVDQAKTGL